ncbi:MAG TPA: TonB-dependent receptor [Aquabacterium sp.]|uniref:TonB-dependent receptor domain-containing protein n=1 Tax=Aquabacterium sp. TaxID=1872578 RepID=UPI002E34355E|nr:TonB-dependent receptor [Aquabacterium sp.]HEX5372531.1 TonB-dependent receptor [Aquabacterium sp.]
MRLSRSTRSRVDRARATAAVIVLGHLPGLGWCQDTSAATADEPMLPAVRVQAHRPPPPTELTLDTTRASTTLGERQLARRQASSVFEVLDGVPGVSVNGGPRASGMSFNIRGYSDNEDIAVRVDGVNKGFEKYRFGGTFIEPDLLQSLEIRRGAQIESPGALGGTVLATTKDAADLLRPGQRLGGRLRAGWASNNHEEHRFAAAYGRPSDALDLLAALSTRQSDDMTLPDGRTLSLSAVNSGSSLLKASWYPADHWTLGASWLRYHDQSLQAYDATGGEPGIFGAAQRRIDDDTLSWRARWRSPDRANEWLLTLGRSHTRVQDHFAPGMAVFANAATGDVDDRITATGHTLDSSARWRVTGDDPNDVQTRTPTLDLRLGLQLGSQTRNSTRRLARMPGRYPQDVNPAQPPGERQSVGLYLQPDWRLGRWQVMPGLRWDHIRTTATGPVAQTLEAAGQARTVRYEHTSPSLWLSLDLVPRQWTVHALWAQAFRPPLMDELFSQSAYGACNNSALTRRYTVPGTYLTPGVSNGVQVAPATGICGDLYELETSRSVEWGVSLNQADVLGPRTRLQGRLIAFRNHTQALLESIAARAGGTRGLEQPGWETRHGIELETSLEGPSAFATLSYSQTRGRTFDGEQTRGLSTAPGRRLQLSLGGRWRDLEAVLRWQRVSERLVVTGTDSQQRPILGTQAGHRLLGLSLRWQINPVLDAALSGENLENTRYLLNNGFGNGAGTEAPGRQIRLSLSGRY